MAPIRNIYNSQLLEYNTTTNEITYQPNYFDPSGNLDLSNTISTSITTAPTTTRQLGFRSQITSGWSNFTTGTSNVNTVTINGTTYAFGVYKLDLYLNYTSAGGGQFTIKACVSTTSATLATPVIFKDTNPPSDDGIFLSTTISAYTNTPFYIVVNGGGGTGTVKTTGTDTSAIILTRIG
jgi:hypothetical protein